MIRRAGLLVCERAKRNLAGDEASLRSSGCIMHGVWAIHKMFDPVVNREDSGDIGRQTLALVFF